MTPILAPISADAFLADVMALAQQVSAKSWRPRFIIGVGRGGLVPAVYLSHALGLPMLSVDISSQVPDFADGLLVRLAERTRAGETLLVVDDINDTGRTIAHLRGALAGAGADANAVRFATLIDNIRSVERVDYAARSIDRAVMKDWFVFPWEAVASRDAITADAASVPERTA
ncbi:phosphoribosyltransferase [Sphingomonas morindae]|uniref:Phosphoribosyltransferase domain-containing protein n=1 Tax=Sphingomonas morindae TaxID=1541170 RepID=A0ABY4XAU3_9SPHN|nr:phosphoribosyltransferase family protein [Sphingomonas morindae]USI74062.1 phosphoribosyltransferase domain-containing protein [Sphingomonas morindae]